MNHKNLKKYLNSKRSIFDTFSVEIIYLYKEGATQASILQFLKDKGIDAKQSNLSRWLSRKKIKINDTAESVVKTHNNQENQKTNIFKNLKG